MSRIKLITKYFVRNAIEEMFTSSKMKPIFVVLLMLFVVNMISMPFTLMVGEGYGPFHNLGQEGVLIAIILSAGSTISFFFGIYTIMNVFYFSDDIEVILPLPFRSSEIVFGKFAAVLINMYIYASMLILPLIVYGVVSGASIIYYFYAFIVLAITPILPMILASLICMALMRFTSLSKHKDAFRMFTGCISLILIIGFNYFNSNSGRNMTTKEILEKFSEGHNTVMDMMTGIFITNKFSAYGLLYNKDLRGLLYTGIALVLSIVLFTAYYYIGGKLYLKGIIGNSEAYSKRENILETGAADKIIKRNSPLKALVSKDIKIMLRTPQFFINCVAMIFYMPGILGVAFLSHGNLSSFRDFLSKGTGSYGLAIAVAFVGGTTCVISGGAGVTALSREGKDFIVSKYIPVHYKTQLYSKILSSLYINELGAIIVALVLLFIKASPIIFTLGTIAAFGAILFITLFGMYFDFRSPKLEWENEKAMFKKNYMPLLIMLIVFILGAALIIAAMFIKNYIIIFGMCMAITLLGSGIFYKGLVNQAYKVYNEK